MNNRTEAKLTDLSGMQKAIEGILKQAWERGRKYGQNEDRPQGDLISRSALKKAVEGLVAGGAERLKDYYENGSKKDENEWIGGVYDAYELINDAPTVVAENATSDRQGEWGCVRVGNTNFITCSHCKEQFETENTLELWQDEYKFCHRCGAKMSS